MSESQRYPKYLHLINIVEDIVVVIFAGKCLIAPVSEVKPLNENFILASLDTAFKSPV